MSTKNRILDAAEALFAEKGLSETSMRAITQAAEVNLAAVNYHFGSKESLIKAVFLRRADALNKARLDYLQKVRSFNQQQPTLEQVLEAYIRPALDLARDEQASRYIKLIGRAYTDPNSQVGQFLPQQYDAVLDEFKPEFMRLLPHLNKLELYWRLHFLVGTLVYCMAGTDAMRMSSLCHLCDPNDTEGMISRLIGFVAAGMRGPADVKPLFDAGVSATEIDQVNLVM